LAKCCVGNRMSAKCCVSQMLCQPNVVSAKCCVGQMLCLPNVMSAKSCVGQMLCRPDGFQRKEVEAFPLAKLHLTFTFFCLFIWFPLFLLATIFH
jgi:hypothetical protein